MTRLLGIAYIVGGHGAGRIAWDELDLHVDRAEQVAVLGSKSGAFMKKMDTKKGA